MRLADAGISGDVHHLAHSRADACPALVEALQYSALRPKLPCGSGALGCGFRARNSRHACTGFANPLSWCVPRLSQSEALVNELARLRGDHHAIRLGDALQLAGKIGRPPYCGHFPRGAFADRFVEDDLRPWRFPTRTAASEMSDGSVTPGLVQSATISNAAMAARSGPCSSPRCGPLALPKYASTPSPMWRSILPPYLSMICCQALKALLSSDLKRSAPIRSSISVELTRSQKTTVRGRRSLSGAGMPFPPNVAIIQIFTSGRLLTSSLWRLGHPSRVAQSEASGAAHVSRGEVSGDY